MFIVLIEILILMSVGDFASSEVNGSSFTPFDSTQEPIFPPELSINHPKYSSTSLQFGKLSNMVKKFFYSRYGPFSDLNIKYKL